MEIDDLLDRRAMLDDNEDNEDASPSEAIGLMPLTTAGGDESASDGAGDNKTLLRHHHYSSAGSDQTSPWFDAAHHYMR